MDGLNDLSVVDALEIDGGDPEIAVAKLALDDDERYAFASHFDGVGVPQLMWSEPSADTCCDGRAPQLGWKPQYTGKQTLKELVAAYREQERVGH